MRNHPVILAFLLTAATLQAGPHRVVVTSDSPEVADVVGAGLTKHPGIAVIERSQAALLFEAAALDAISKDPDKRRKLGEFLGAEQILDIRPVGENSWDLRVVAAASGGLLGTRQIKATLETLPAEAARLLERSMAPPPTRGPKVVILDFARRLEANNAEELALLRLAGELRLRLAEVGIEVLDRTASAQVRNEHALSEEGWTAPLTGPMSGADCVVEGGLSEDGHELRLSVLRVSSGHQSAAADFPFSSASPSLESERMTTWILRKLGASTAETKGSRTPSRQVEALEPFYKGIALIREGRDLAAIEEFQKAYSLNDKFTEAYLWEAECYEKAGLAPLGVALRAFLDRNVVGKGISSADAAGEIEGTTFLGITGATDALRHKLEILVTEASGSKSGRLLLPENLAAFRDEYDVLLGVKNSRGTTWADAPDFLTSQTLSGRIEPEDDRHALVLELHDTVSGKRRASTRVLLDSDTSAWPESLSAAMLQLGSQSHRASRETPVAHKPQEPADKTSENTRILQLALDDPAALAARWQPLEKPSYNLPRALNFALRAYILDRLPEGNPSRPWLELERIAVFLPFDPWAGPYASQAPEPISELKEFVRRHPDDAPGLVGEYMLLWETMSALSYVELERRWDLLDKRISLLPAQEPIAGWEKFRKMPSQLRDLARVAQGHRDKLPPCDDWFAAPHRMIPRVGAGSRLSLEIASPWGVREWRNMPRIAPPDAIHEARAGLAILGRRNNRFAVDPRWMEEFPNSLALTSYVIRSLREADRDEGLPLLFPLDARAERAAFLAKVHYVHAQLRREISLAESPKELDWIENGHLRDFFSALSRPGFRRTLSDDEVDSMHKTLAAEVDGAAVRLGRTSRPASEDSLLDWRRINRSVSSFADPRWWTRDQVNIYDRDALAARVAKLLAQSADTPLLSSPWYRMMNSFPYATLAPNQRAGLLSAGCAHLTDDNKDLSPDEMGRLVSLAAALIAGKHYLEAGKILRLVEETPESDANRTQKGTAARANAALQLAALALHDGREIEAVDRLRRILAEAPTRPVELIEDGGWHPRHFESVQSVALRLLSDLRATEPAAHDERGVVRVNTPGYFPGKVLFRFRAPSGRDPADNTKMPVLVIAPSVNAGAEDFFREGSAWAHFADTQGVFLLVPQFMEFWSDSTLPQDWSGEALRLALANLRESHPIDTERLYFHGFGFGASFLQRVALWKPDWCAAASLHSTFDWAWEEALPEGLHPLSALQNTPLFVTCGEEDGSPDHAIRGSFAPTVRFVTYAKDAGVPVAWQPLADVVHRPTREMEDSARAFLVEQFAKRRPGGDQ